MPSYKRTRSGSKKVTSYKKYSKGKVYAPLKRYAAVTPKYSSIYAFKRYTTINYLYSRQVGFQNTGLTVASPYLGMVFSLTQATPFIGGTVDNTSVGTLPNSTELGAVFDQYRIKGILVEVFFSHNTSTSGDPLLPILRQALDFDSVDGVNSLNEYQNRRVHQLGATPIGSLKFHLYNPTVQGVNQDTLGSVGSSSAVVSPWLDTNAPLVPHFGMRFEASNFQDTTAGTVGRFQFNIEYDLEFRRPR